jgi:hypothetical protein
MDLLQQYYEALGLIITRYSACAVPCPDSVRAWRSICRPQHRP